MASPRSDRCDKIRRKGVYIYYTRIEFCDARRHRYFLSFFERIDFFLFSTYQRAILWRRSPSKRSASSSSLPFCTSSASAWIGFAFDRTFDPLFSSLLNIRHERYYTYRILFIEWLDTTRNNIVCMYTWITYETLNLKCFTLYAPPPSPLIVDKLFESVCSVLGNGQQFGQFAAFSRMAVSRGNDTNTLLLGAGEQRCTFWKSRREQRARHRPTNRPHYRTGYDDHVALFIDTAYSIEVREFSRESLRFPFVTDSRIVEKSPRDESSRIPGTTNCGTCLSSSHEPAYDSDERPRSRSNSKEDRPARWICAALRISSSRTIWWTWAAIQTFFFFSFDGDESSTMDDSIYIYIYKFINFISIVT